MGKASKTKSEARTTPLSKEQTRIVAERAAEWRNYFAPILKRELARTEDGTTQSALTDHALGAVNREYQQASGNLVRSLDQRQVEGGMRTSALAALEAARANAASDVKRQAYAANKQHQQGLLQLSANMSPQPTQATGYQQQSVTRPIGLGKYL